MANLVESSELSYTQVIRLRCCPAVIINQACVYVSREQTGHTGKGVAAPLGPAWHSELSHSCRDSGLLLSCHHPTASNRQKPHSSLTKETRSSRELTTLPSGSTDADYETKTHRRRTPMTPSQIRCWHPKHLVSPKNFTSTV